MDSENKTEKEGRQRVHTVLAHSYAFYFIAFLVGLFLDFIFPLDIFRENNEIPIGVMLIVLGSLLIFWAQKTSRNFKKENLTKKNFSKGPYCFTRTPTHWGLFLLMLGFGVLINAFFIIIFAVISFIVTKLVFLKKEEIILEGKYGDPYIEYKKLVRF